MGWVNKRWCASCIAQLFSLPGLQQELAKEKILSQELANQLSSEKMQSQDIVCQLANEKLKSQELDNKLANEKMQVKKLANQLAEIHEKHERLEAQCKLSSFSAEDTGVQKGGSGGDTSQILPGAASKEVHDQGTGTDRERDPEWEHQGQRECVSLPKALQAVEDQLSGSQDKAADFTVTTDTLETKEPLGKRLIEVERQVCTCVSFQC